MSPLHIRHQGLIWNQRQPLSEAREGTVRKKRCDERGNLYWNWVRVQQRRSHSEVVLPLAQLRPMTLQHQNPDPEEKPGPIFHHRPRAARGVCDTNKTFTKKRKQP